MAEKLAIYIRLSKEDDDVKSSAEKIESNSITNQRLLIREYIATHKEFNQYEIIEKIDDGFSGSTFDRPAFLEMIELAKRQEIKCIIVKDMSRFGRNYIEVGDYIEQIFPFLGIRFISINDHYDSNNNGNKTAGLDMAFRNFVYDSYSKDTSKKIRNTRAKLAKEGKFASAKSPYGYEKDSKDRHHLVINPETAPVVKKIFTMRLEGYSARRITKFLNAKGIPSPAQYAINKGKGMDWRRINELAAWDSAKVMAILRDERYAGNMISLKRRIVGVRGSEQKVPKEDWVRVENTHKGIISMELFLQVQELLPEIKKNNQHSQDYNPLVCGCCGRHLSLSRDGKKYICRYGEVNPKAECYDAKFEVRELNDVLWEELQWHFKLFLKMDDLFQGAKEKNKIIKSNVQLYKKSIRLLEKASIEQYEDYKSGLLSKEKYIEMKAECNSKIKEYETLFTQEKNEIEEVNQNAEQYQTVRMLVEKYIHEPEMTKEMRMKFIEKVEVYSEQRMKIIWKFADVFDEKK